MPLRQLLLPRTPFPFWRVPVSPPAGLPHTLRPAEPARLYRTGIPRDDPPVLSETNAG